jgi:hypothetical protein
MKTASGIIRRNGFKVCLTNKSYVIIPCPKIITLNRDASYRFRVLHPVLWSDLHRRRDKQYFDFIN